MLRSIASLLIAALAATACAKPNVEPAVVAEKPAAEILTQDQIAARLVSIRPDLQLTNMAQSEIAGFYKGTIQGGPDVHISHDGKHLLSGGIFEITDAGLVDLKDKALASVRQEAVASLQESGMIVFKPEGETKAVVNVFTDVDCGYCRKLHMEMANYHAAGIEVRYLAYPRAGIGSPSYNKIASAWCSADQQDALTKLKMRQPIPENICDGNPVADHYALGGRLGVRGTPALLLEDGRLLPGYRDAKALSAELGI